MFKKSFRYSRIVHPTVWPDSVNENVNLKLLFACTFQRVSLAKEALSQGANVNCKRSDYLTPLHIAVQYDDVELIQVLCNHPSTNLEIKTIDGLTPLHKAVLLGHRYSVEELIEHGASVNCTDNLGRHPLHYSALRRDIATATILIINGARVNVYDIFQESPLHTSIIRRRFTPMIKLLLFYGAKISSAPDQVSLNLFLEAVLCTRTVSDMKVVDLLYHNGADVNSTDFIGLRTPLHIAAMTGNLKLATYLIKMGADLNLKNKAGHTPMTVAALCHNYEIEQLIKNSLEKGFEIDRASSIINIEED